MFDTDIYKDKMQNALDHFSEELKKVRTGRAHANMLDGIEIEAYGVKMPLNQVANITAPEAQMLLVTPFDPSNIAAIEASIRANDDGRVVRIPVPPLTEERRKQMVKLASEKVEDVRISMRNIRQDALKEAKNLKENKELSEDDMKLIEKEIDKLMSEMQTKIDAIFDSKKKEILTV